MSLDFGDAQMKQAEAFFRGTEALCKFANKHVVPVLVGILSPNDYERALFDTYYRMQFWLLSLEKLDYPSHFQAVLNAARGTYELLLDLKLLQADHSLAAKYHAFPFVAHFSTAKKYIDELARNPGHSPPPPAPKPDKRLQFVSDVGNKKKFDDERRLHWGTGKNGKPITPEHWSGLTMPERAAKLSVEELLRYRLLYAQLCWYVHPGSAGTAGISPGGLLAAFTWGHGQVQEFFFEGTELLCDGQKLFTAIPELRQQFEQAKAAVGLFMVNSGLVPASPPAAG
jgi:hypothetical protein